MTEQEVQQMNYAAQRKGITFQPLGSGVFDLRGPNGQSLKRITATSLGNFVDQVNAMPAPLVSVAGSTMQTATADTSSNAVVLSGGGAMDTPQTQTMGTKTFSYDFAVNGAAAVKLYIGDLLGFIKGAINYPEVSFTDGFTDTNNSVVRTNFSFFNFDGVQGTRQSFLRFLGAQLTGGFTITKLTVTMADNTISATLLRDVWHWVPSTSDYWGAAKRIVNLKPTLGQGQFQESVQILEGALTIGPNEALELNIPAGYKPFNLSIEIAPTNGFYNMYSAVK